MRKKCLPSLTEPSLNLGFSFKPLQKKDQYITLSADSHSINQASHYSQKLNFGFEWGWRSSIKIQAGLKAGYLTAGAQLDVGLLNLRVCSYIVDHSPIVGLSEAMIERRYALQFKALI